MRTLVDLYQIQVIWNREFDFVNYSIPEQEFDKAKAKVEAIINSGDGASVKKYRILNSERNVVYPLSAIPTEKKSNLEYPKLYTCSFCEKQEYGKPYSYLIKPSPNSKHDISLKPDNWDWMYVEPCKNDRISWSCGCHKFNKNK